MIKRNPKAGQPTLFKAEYCEQAYRLCLLGAKDKEIAEFFGVDERTINRWKEAHSKFCQSLKEGKEDADSVIAKSLYHRAKGYSHPEVHISVWQGQVIETQLTKHYPPDTTACIFWLKNRQSDKWRDRHEFTGKDGKDLYSDVVLAMAQARAKESRQ